MPAERQCRQRGVETVQAQPGGLRLVGEQCHAAADGRADHRPHCGIRVGDEHADDDQQTGQRLVEQEDLAHAARQRVQRVGFDEAAGRGAGDQQYGPAQQHEGCGVGDQQLAAALAPLVGDDAGQAAGGDDQGGQYDRPGQHGADQDADQHAVVAVQPGLAVGTVVAACLGGEQAGQGAEQGTTDQAGGGQQDGQQAAQAAQGVAQQQHLAEAVE
ncbi:hypothetical protein D3C76_1258690 [compost metagenome]